MLLSHEIKQLVAHEAAALVRAGTVIGIGSGSTISCFIEILGRRIHNGLQCLAVPTSRQTLEMALHHGIPVKDLNEVSAIDLAIDGADEIDEDLQLIKGGGGALLQEKMVAAASKRLVIIADHSKLHDRLGHFPLPVEVIPYGWQQVRRRIETGYHIKCTLRMNNDQPFVTDHGHYILDCHWGSIPDPGMLNSSLHLLPGVVETGLFVNMCSQAIIGYPDGTVNHLYRDNL